MINYMSRLLLSELGHSLYVSTINLEILNEDFRLKEVSQVVTRELTSLLLEMVKRDPDLDALLIVNAFHDFVIHRLLRKLIIIEIPCR